MSLLDLLSHVSVKWETCIAFLGEVDCPCQYRLPLDMTEEVAHARSKVEALQYSCQYTSINSSAHPLSSISLSLLLFVR